MWQELYEYFQVQSFEQVQLSEKNIIFNKIHPTPTHVLNMVCLITKEYIYLKKCRNADLSIRELKMQILTIESLEKYIAQKNGKLKKHNRKWYPNRADNQENIDSIEDYVDRYLESL